MEPVTSTKGPIGNPINRVEGRLKVTGQARYAAEYNLPQVAHGVLVTITVAKGRIRTLDTRAAQRAPGVLYVLTHQNRPEMPGFDAEPNPNQGRVYGQEFRVFYDDQIYYSNQPVALVIADTLERADAAAALVQVTYDEEPHKTDLTTNQDQAITPARSSDYSRGDTQALNSAPVVVEQEYHTPIHVHNPMEPHAATVVWQDEDHVTVYNKAQTVILARQDISKSFGIPEENVHAISPFVGGAFGCSSRVWPEEMAAIMGAKQVNRPVKVALKRDQAFNMVGYRPRSIQKVSLGATKDGRLISTRHQGWGVTSTYEQFTERMLDPTKTMYHCPNLEATYQLVPLDLSTPCWTRGPGESSGSFALESAMDELAYALNMDPLALRLKNYAERDPEVDLPWSSKHLKECYERGAERFGWSRRNPQPRSMRTGDMLVGQGMSSGIYKADRTTAEARATLRPDGTVLIQTSVADTGPGSATIMTQIAAETLGLNVEQVLFEWGDSRFPPAPGQFGSHTTTSVGGAVHDVCQALQGKIKGLATSGEISAFRGMNPSGIIIEGGVIRAKDGSHRVGCGEMLQQLKLPEVQARVTSDKPPEMQDYSSKSFCATFVEVHVHPATGMVKVTRVVSALDVGRIMNHKTATNQVYGCTTWGIGMALMEEGVLDHRYGTYLNNDLAEYHVPVHADMPEIDVIFTEKPDPIVSPVGAKGMGEIGLIGFAAAIANAVYHATGKRIRELPITPDKLIG